VPMVRLTDHIIGKRKKLLVVKVENKVFFGWTKNIPYQELRVKTNFSRYWNLFKRLNSFNKYFSYNTQKSKNQIPDHIFKEE